MLGATVDEEERERRKELSKYAGPREFFRIGCFMMGWVFLGLIIGLILTLVFHIKENIGTIVFVIIGFTSFIFPFVALFWKPARSVMNKVIGNKNLKTQTIPLSTVKLTFKKRPWYYYLIILWEWSLVITLFYLAIKYFTK
jgi:hypothetical protein